MILADQYRYNRSLRAMIWDNRHTRRSTTISTVTSPTNGSTGFKSAARGRFAGGPASLTRPIRITRAAICAIWSPKLKSMTPFKTQTTLTMWFFYDAALRPIQQDLPTGGSETASYNDAAMTASFTKPGLGTNTSTYDGFGRVIQA